MEQFEIETELDLTEIILKINHRSCNAKTVQLKIHLSADLLNLNT